MQLVKGDIQSMDLLSFVLQAEEIDTIMHFAAQVGAPTARLFCSCADRWPVQAALVTHSTLEQHSNTARDNTARDCRFCSLLCLLRWLYQQLRRKQHSSQVAASTNLALACTAALPGL